MDEFLKIEVALFGANAALKERDIDALHHYINSAQIAMQSIAPQCKQSQHLAGFVAESRKCTEVQNDRPTQ